MATGSSSNLICDVKYGFKQTQTSRSKQFVNNISQSQTHLQTPTQTHMQRAPKIKEHVELSTRCCRSVWCMTVDVTVCYQVICSASLPILPSVTFLKEYADVHRYNRAIGGGLLSMWWQLLPKPYSRMRHLQFVSQQQRTGQCNFLSCPCMCLQPPPLIRGQFTRRNMSERAQPREYCGRSAPGPYAEENLFFL